MGFHYAKEKAHFDRKWARLRNEYEQAGMSAAGIQKIYEYDWHYFCSQRIYVNRTQPIPDMYVTEANPCNRSALMKKFESLSSSFDECDFTGRHAWIDTIDDPRLIVVLKKLTEKELDVLTYLILEEHSQAELAQKWGCSQKAISKQLHKIKKYFQ